MNLNEAYLRHKQHPTPDTLSTLLTACRSYALALAYSYSLREADDAAQAAVVTAWRSLDKYDQSRSMFSTWFHGIAKNRLFEEFRDLKRARSHLLLNEDELEATVSCSEVDTEAVAAIVFRMIPDDSLEQRLSQLILAGHTLRSAARVCGMKEDAARKRLRRLGASMT